MNIVKGKQVSPLKAILYGPEGIGKSTFASHWPRPLFIDFENGTKRLPVDRVAVESYPELEQLLGQLFKDHSAYQTVVFDTADWLDRLCMRNVCDVAGKKGIEEFGYGKGYTYLAELWGSFLDRLTRFGSMTGMHLVFLAHAALRKFEQPDEAGAYDRWEMKCAKTVTPLLKEWADLLLFANYKTLVVTGDNGKAKAAGGKRVLYTTHHPCWDAKNRFSLPEELPFEADAIASPLAAVIAENTASVPAAAKAPEPVPELKPEAKPAPKPAEPKPAAAPKPAEPEPVPEPSPEPPADPQREEALRQVRTLMEMAGISPAQLQGEVARRGVCPADMPIDDYNLATLKRIAAGWQVIKRNINQE